MDDKCILEARLQGKWNSNKDCVADQTIAAAVGILSPPPYVMMKVEGAAERWQNRPMARITPWTLLELHEGQFYPTKFSGQRGIRYAESYWYYISSAAEIY